eukprot:jgi/Botrbrau1/2770/Bobra.0164s0047.1
MASHWIKGYQCVFRHPPELSAGSSSARDLIPRTVRCETGEGWRYKTGRQKASPGEILARQSTAKPSSSRVPGEATVPASPRQPDGNSISAPPGGTRDVAGDLSKTPGNSRRQQLKKELDDWFDDPDWADAGVLSAKSSKKQEPKAPWRARTENRSEGPSGPPDPSGTGGTKQRLEGRDGAKGTSASGPKQFEGPNSKVSDNADAPEGGAYRRRGGRGSQYYEEDGEARDRQGERPKRTTRRTQFGTNGLPERQDRSGGRRYEAGGEGRSRRGERWDRGGGSAGSSDRWGPDRGIPRDFANEENEREWRGPSATFHSADSFQDLGMSGEMVAALEGMGIQRPSHVQAAALRAFQDPSRSHLVIADHAGSGKTLAYLLPLVAALKEAERAAERGPQAYGAFSAPREPAIVVLAPTRELCVQVAAVARSLARGLPFRTVIATGGSSLQTPKQALEEGVDLLVGTPARLAELAGKGYLHLPACKALVLDEVDVLLPAEDAQESVVPLLRGVSSVTRLVFVTATLPEAVWWDLSAQFPGVSPVLGPGLHRTAPSVLEQLVDCSGGEEVSEESGFARKAEALLGALRQKPATHTIVFCNKIETCRKVENVLNRNSGKDIPEIEVLPYHSAIDRAKQELFFKSFMAPPAVGKAKVLVCTDRTSRGIDTAHVQHVVLFDFPRDPSEYLRRAGRTARGAGGQGLVTLLVLGRQVGPARDLMRRNEKGLPIHKVPTP